MKSPPPQTKNNLDESNPQSPSSPPINVFKQVELDDIRATIVVDPVKKIQHESPDTKQQEETEHRKTEIIVSPKQSQETSPPKIQKSESTQSVIRRRKKSLVGKGQEKETPCWLSIAVPCVVIVLMVLIGIIYAQTVSINKIRT